MLELRPVCENCARSLPPSSPDAMICSFECTFCRTCVDEDLSGICPNCGGGFVPRPIRPARDWVGGSSLDAYPAATEARHRPVDIGAHQALVERMAGIPPGER